ncbi:MAG: thymidine phosphorylase, partial [Nanoarchaeota archaeon]
FVTLGKHLGIEVHVLFTQSSQPVGNGIGPALEARDIIWVLTDDRRGPADLRVKSLLMAGKMLEMGGKARKGEGGKLAQHILDSGLAYKKFVQMIRAQGGARIIDANKVPISPLTHDALAWKTGRITDMDNHQIAQIAKDAGAPSDKGSGIYLHAHLHWKVNKGDILYTIHAHNRDELAYALDTAKKNPGLTIT